MTYTLDFHLYLKKALQPGTILLINGLSQYKPGHYMALIIIVYYDTSAESW